MYKNKKIEKKTFFEKQNEKFLDWGTEVPEVPEVPKYRSTGVPEYRSTLNIIQ